MPKKDWRAPIYAHDCERCVYIGPAKNNDKPVDVYVCPQPGFGPTVLFRESDEQGDYASYPLYCVEEYGPLFAQALIDGLNNHFKTRTSRLSLQY